MKLQRHAIVALSALQLCAAVWFFARLSQPVLSEDLASRIQGATTGREWRQAVLDGMDTHELCVSMMLSDLDAILGQPYMSYRIDGRSDCVRSLYHEPQPPPYGDPLPPTAIPMPWQAPGPRGWYLIVDSCNGKVTDLRLSIAHGK